MGVVDIETELPDLTGVTLADLRTCPDAEEATRVVVAQVQRPRRNLGSSGPPGRAD